MTHRGPFQPLPFCGSVSWRRALKCTSAGMPLLKPSSSFCSECWEPLQPFQSNTRSPGLLVSSQQNWKHCHSPHCG